ncbi:MAG: type II secretion system protein [Pirellulaceae bacterium]|nr:type II secretion system protein [Pirellulaceae bacterium]
MIRTEHGFFTGRMNQRGGYSLLEVILATAILAGSSLMLATLISNGANLGNRAQERAEALLIAQTLIDETLATRHGESFEEEEPFSESSLWSYRLRAETQEDLGVIVVTAEVFPLDDEGGVSSVSETPVVRLVRWYLPRHGVDMYSGEMQTKGEEE